jgi:quercetin dioxygenase-like cupin family protein
MSVLIRGRFRLEFHDGNRARDLLLEREGDYALWDAGVPHNWVAEEDSVMLTVRWPSVPEDQVNDTK